MELLNVTHLIPMFLIGGMDAGALLDGLDFVELIFGVLNQLTFLVDIFIGAALVAAVIRGLTKGFWKIMWRSLIFVILLAVLYIAAGQLVTSVGALGLKLSGEVGGTAVEWNSLREILEGVIMVAGNNQEYATAMTDVILKNLVIFIGVPLISIVTPIISAITFPLINLAIPRKLKKIKLIPVKLAVSVAFSVLAIMVFAIPMATLVPPLSAIREVMVDDTIMKKFMNPELIGFLELFTAEKSFLLKIVSLGNTANSMNIFKSFVAGSETVQLSEALPGLFETLNTITYTMTSGGAAAGA